jgi:hypothetical protein
MAAATLSFCLHQPTTHAQNTTANEGGDLAFGGAGTAEGQFLELRDLTFDARGNGYALDGTRLNSQKQREGNLRVQKFDSTGKILAAFSIADPALGDKQDPQRIAATADGSTFITQPAAGLVQMYAPVGKKARDIPIPQARAITVWTVDGAERVAVVPSSREIVDGKWAWLGGGKVLVLTPRGEIEREIALEKTLEGVQDATADRAGNLYIQAEPNAIYKFSPSGKLLQTFGGNPTTRNSGGSEVLHTVAVDSKGNVFTMAWGNPGLVTRFDAGGAGVSQREGQFKWADPWSIHSNYTPLAIDPSDRLWAGATARHAADYVHLKTQRAVPAIIRTKTEFWTENPDAVIQRPLRALGFRPSLKSGLAYNVAYEPNKPVAMTLSVAAANRFVSNVQAIWRAFDVGKKEVARGELSLPLQNGQEASAQFSWTPPRFGSYFVQATLSSGGAPMGALGEHVGVTPRFANVPILAEGESKGGWTDAPRQMWSGQPNIRIHPARDEKGLEKTDEEIALGEKYGATVLLQLVDNMKDLSPEHVRRVVARYKGRVKYYEVCNEPNFTSKVDEYFAGHKMAHAAIKEIDPRAVVMGPATVNIDLGWLKRLYDLGFKDITDAISLHDYEGHESITPEHWEWKFGKARAIMAAAGDGAKPIWQTERAIAGVRGNNFQGLAQAIRTTLHRDLLETLGIPSEHNNHYYLNQGGYSSVPTYTWSSNGPHPAALALRTRHALTTALDRKYAGRLDFGPHNNHLLLGVRYAGAKPGLAGETVVLRNLGTRPMALDFEVRGQNPAVGARALPTTDTWGNAQNVVVSAGRVRTARLTVGQLPLYVRLAPGQQLVAPKLNFGQPVKAAPTWTYSTVTKSDPALLSNGVLETYHSGNPNGDTNGEKIWTGDMKPATAAATDGESPQVLEGSFAAPQRLSAIVVRGVRADNAFCALLDYDLEVHDGRAWKSIEKVRTPMPASEEAKSADATHAIWMDDTNFFIHRFAPVTASKIRLTARRVSRGFVPDDRALAWSKPHAPKLMLREIELYAPSALASAAR